MYSPSRKYALGHALISAMLQTAARKRKMAEGPSRATSGLMRRSKAASFDHVVGAGKERRWARPSGEVRRFPWFGNPKVWYRRRLASAHFSY
jgi:hypothetical protein